MKHLLGALCLLATWLPMGCGAAVESSAATPAKPNLLVIEVDDLDEPMFDLLLKNGWLPNIQHNLIEQGVRFSNSFVSDAVCCPSRATYLTGQYVNNHGILGVSKGVAYWYYGKDNREPYVIPVLLHNAGYYTGHIGKYLNGYGMYSKDDHVPPGYTEWYGLLDPYTYDVYRWKQNVTLDGKTRIIDHEDADGPYQTDALKDEALGFLDRATRSGKPFYLAFKPVAPHVETRSFRDDDKLGFRTTFREWIRPAPRHECLVRAELGDQAKTRKDADTAICRRKLPDSLAFLQARKSFNVIDAGKPQNIRDRVQLLTQKGGDLEAVKRQHQMRMASMLAVDDAVGSLFEKLSQTGALDKTLVVFTSDNGYFHGEHQLDSKLLPYEESIRVPLVIRPPGGSKETSTAAIALNNDLAPTLGAYAGVRPMRENDQWDGRSLKPWLDGESPAWRKQFMVEHFIELTVLQLSQEHEWFGKLTEAVTSLLEKGAGIEFGSLKNMSYPAYKAVRRIDPDAGQDVLYVQWYSNVRNTDADGWNRDFEELYDLKQDPWEMDNLLYQQNQGYAANKDSPRSNSLRKSLSGLMRCDAEQCDRLEDTD